MNEQESSERVCSDPCLTDGCSGQGDEAAQIGNKKVKRLKSAANEGNLYWGL